MAMSRKKRRSMMILGGLAILGMAVGLALYGLSDKVTFFFSPSEIEAKHVRPGQRIRLGGLVEKGSVKRGGDGVEIHFRITDTEKSVPVVYRGVLPDLFAEGEGVVAEGHMDDSGLFHAGSVLAKHDEKYMSREVAESLRKKGWLRQKKNGGDNGGV